MSYEPNPVVRAVGTADPAAGGAVRVVRATPEVPVAVEPGHVLVDQPVAVQQPVPVQQVVVQRPLQPVQRRRVTTSWGLFHAWDSVVVGIIGTALLLIGLIALVRAGTDGPWDQPVVEVLGFTHTAILGIIEIAFGACLLLCAVTLSRGAATFFGALLGIGGFVGAVQAESFRRTLALESSLAWLMVLAAVVIIVVSAIVPRVIVTRTTTASYVEPY